jgi:hypothetical protein
MYNTKNFNNAMDIGVLILLSETTLLILIDECKIIKSYVKKYKTI